jgi:predicted CXXCH cytochrome family protein
VRRLALAVAAGAVWLFLAALPVLADGGPHVASINSGSAGITADSCAGCHRAHTAQASFLLSEDEPAMCLVCHGASGTGATTDVESGIQYSAGTTQVRGGASVGALRSGGFVEARIASGSPTRLSFQVPARGSGFTGLVPVAASGTAITSAHMDLSGASSGIAWGNGPINATADVGPTVDLSCTTCHNPHGNGKYRILNAIPAPTVVSGTFTPPASAANVTDAAAVPAGETRNYTNSRVQLVSQLAGDTSTRDYWRYCTPWNNCSGSNRGDKPNGLPSAPFRTQISAWCSTCHSRYLAGGGSATYEGGPSGDAIFAFRHTTTITPECTQCHVAHGSNAAMPGQYSSSFPYPGGAAPASASSRLLKIDNRGTCQMCHDPTGTVTTAGVTTP